MRQAKQLGIGEFLLATLLVVMASMSVLAQQAQKVWITLRDRGPVAQLSKLNAEDLGISNHALWRRAKVLPADKLVDELDLPVNQSYIEQLKAAGVTIRATSRWFNAVSAELTPAQQSAVSSLPFVASVGTVAVFVRHEAKNSSSVSPQSLSKQASTLDLNYGPSLTQLSDINVVAVHNLHIDGSGVIVGMLDDGFNYRTVHPALKNIKVIGDTDIVQNDNNTSIAPGEYIGQGDHGESTLSVLGGYLSGQLIGVAYGATFVLAKTEVDSSGSNDFHIEEDYYIAGLEWEERLGAEVVSSSLGYNTFDPGPSYSYQDMNGNTGVTTKAARIAARKGVLLVTAMGNEGNYQSGKLTGTLITPADADSIVSVGAVWSDGSIASFSSTGPTSDGRIKPEVVAQGVNVYTASGTGSYNPTAAGTSYSTPLTAGVAALILSANHELTPMQVRNALMQTAKPLYNTAAGMTSRPNNFFGWGMVDALKAVQSTTSVDKNDNGIIPTQFVLNNNYPNPFNGSTAIVVDAPAVKEMELSIYNILGQKVRTLFKGTSTPGTSTFYWRDGLDDANNHVATGIYFCRLNVAGAVRTLKIVYLK